MVLNSVTLLVLLGLTNAPGGPAQRESTPRRSGVCALVTREEIERELGQPVGEGKEDLTGPGASCTFSGSYGEVTVTLQRAAQKLDIAAEVATLKAGIAGAAVRQISGMGTSAFVLKIGDSGAQIHVVRGERDYLMVSVLGFGNAAHVAGRAQRLAGKALERM